MGSGGDWLSVIVLAALAAPLAAMAADDDEENGPPRARQPQQTRQMAPSAPALRRLPEIGKPERLHPSRGGRAAETAAPAERRLPARLRRRSRGEVCCRMRGTRGKIITHRTSGAACRKNKGRAVDFRHCRNAPGCRATPRERLRPDGKPFALRHPRGCPADSAAREVRG